MEIRRNCNTIINYNIGDGFRSLALRGLTAQADSLVVTTRSMIECFYKNKKKAISSHSVAKSIESNDYSNINLIFIDYFLLNSESKSHRAMINLCKGKQVVFIHPPITENGLISAMELMSVTKNINLRSIKFSRFLYFRGQW